MVLTSHKDNRIIDNKKGYNDNPGWSAYVVLNNNFSKYKVVNLETVNSSIPE